MGREQNGWKKWSNRHERQALFAGKLQLTAVAVLSSAAEYTLHP